MNLLTAVKDPRLQVRYNAPDEKVMGLLGLRAAGLDHVFEHNILAVPVMEMPVSVFFNVPRIAAVEFADRTRLALISHYLLVISFSSTAKASDRHPAGTSSI